MEKFQQQTIDMLQNLINNLESGNIEIIEKKGDVLESGHVLLLLEFSGTPDENL